MAGAGPDPAGSGPVPPFEVEAARRRLYAPGGRTPAAVAEYERLVAGSPRQRAARPHPEAQPHRTATAAATGDAARTSPRRRKRLLIAVGAVLVTAVVVIALVTARPALPQAVDAPPLAGTTLVAYDRPLQDGVAPGQVTYQPEGYTVYQPRGRVVQVALRCIGAGTVRINAGARFDFTCTDREAAFVLSDIGPRSAPFVIMGITAGNVVWGARIVLTDSVGARTIATTARAG